MRTPLVVLVTLVPLVALAVPAFAAEPPPADAIVTFAQIAAKEGDYATAEKALREGMAVHPEHHGFHLLLGSVLAEEGKLDEAFYELEYEFLRAGGSRREGATAAQIAAVVADQAGPGGEPRRFLAALSLASSDPGRARTQLAAISKTRGERLVFLALDGDLAWLAGDTAAAERSYRAILAKDPRYVPAIVGLANVAAARGDASGADALVARARSLDAQRADEVLP